MTAARTTAARPSSTAAGAPLALPMSATKKPSVRRDLARDTTAPPRAAPVAGLDAGERKLLAEALRRAEEARNVMEDALVAFGRWLLVHVFDDGS